MFVLNSTEQTVSTVGSCPKHQVEMRLHLARVWRQSCRDVLSSLLGGVMLRAASERGIKGAKQPISAGIILHCRDQNRWTWTWSAICCWWTGMQCNRRACPRRASSPAPVVAIRARRPLFSLRCLLQSYRTVEMRTALFLCTW